MRSAAVLFAVLLVFASSLQQHRPELAEKLQAKLVALGGSIWSWTPSQGSLHGIEAGMQVAPAVPVSVPAQPSNAAQNSSSVSIPAGQVEVVAHGTPGLDDQSVCHLQGSVDECCNCSYQAVDQLNQAAVYPTVHELVQLPFFRYFKVNLWCDCPLWPDDGMCMLRACSVCECEPSEVPKPWVMAEQGLSSGPSCSSTEQEAQEKGCNSALCAAEADGVVDRALEPQMAAALQHLRGWRGFNNPWMAEGDDGEEYSYINLLVNPERFTGYKGEHAHRIWSSIYNQSCLQGPLDSKEKRVFFRLISGMHASISAHIAANYLLDEEAGVWGPSPAEFKARLGTPDVRYRVENLYFAYLFVLRAVMKAGTLLTRFEYQTGYPQEDARTAELIRQLVANPELQSACPMPFDEGRLWKGEQGPELLEQMQAAFRNITRIMDCVGCEKCKLWGKLQTLGIATALKVLFSSSDCDGLAPGEGQPGGNLSLERNEVIALVNLLERFAASLTYYKRMAAEQAAAGAGQLLLSVGDTVN